LRDIEKYDENPNNLTYLFSGNLYFLKNLKTSKYPDLYIALDEDHTKKTNLCDYADHYLYIHPYKKIFLMIFSSDDAIDKDNFCNKIYNQEKVNEFMDPKSKVKIELFKSFVRKEDTFTDTINSYVLESEDRLEKMKINAVAIEMYEQAVLSGLTLILAKKRYHLKVNAGLQETSLLYLLLRKIEDDLHKFVKNQIKKFTFEEKNTGDAKKHPPKPIMEDIKVATEKVLTLLIFHNVLSTLFVESEVKNKQKIYIKKTIANVKEMEKMPSACKIFASIQDHGFFTESISQRSMENYMQSDRWQKLSYITTKNLNTNRGMSEFIHQIIVKNVEKNVGKNGDIRMAEDPTNSSAKAMFKFIDSIKDCKAYLSNIFTTGTREITNMSLLLREMLGNLDPTADYRKILI